MLHGDHGAWSNRIESNRIESNRIESNRIGFLALVARFAALSRAHDRGSVTSGATSLSRATELRPSAAPRSLAPFVALARRDDDASGVFSSSSLTISSSSPRVSLLPRARGAGWQLGERGMWSKNTNWEPAVRVPFVVAVPWLAGLAGTRTDELAELVRRPSATATSR